MASPSLQLVTSNPEFSRPSRYPPESQTEMDSNGMATEDDLEKARIAESEARTETKIARLEGKLDLVLSKLDDVREDNRSTRANQWVIGLGLAVLIVAIAALFPVFFDLGSKVHDLIDRTVQSHLSLGGTK